MSSFFNGASALGIARHRRCLAATRHLLFNYISHQDARKARPASPPVDDLRTSLRRQLREKRGAQYRTSSDDAVRRLPAFEDVGVDVAAKFVKGEEVLDKMEWDREQGLDSLAQELVDLHEELQGALVARDDRREVQEDGRRVEHLGHGVFVQHNVMSLDRDGQKNSPNTIIREESRNVVKHALDALKHTDAVAVTGQPGIGKTRGCMMYALQTLLHRRAAVLYVGYKSGKMLLFLPREDGTHRVWSSRSDLFGITSLSLEKRLVSIIDPPEDGPYFSMGECRVLKFVSNNADKHFRNWTKDGVLLVTSMPSEREVVAMTKVLWNDENTPHPWQRGEFNTLQEKLAEVEKRIELVGPIPRLIFHSMLFIDAVKECLQGANEAALKVSNSDVYRALRGKYTPFLAKHPASASSKLFLLSPGTVEHRTWEERARHSAAFQLTPIATFLLHDRLKESILALRKEQFEDFAFDWLCMMEGRDAEVQSKGKGVHDAAYNRIASLRREEERVYRPAAGNFAFVDFASSVTTWYNAKSSNENVKSVYINEDGAKQFLTRLEQVMKGMFSGHEIKKILEHEAVSLTVLTNGSAQPKINDPGKSLQFFSEHVALKAINVTDEMATKPLEDRVHRTKLLLEELHFEV